MNGKQLFAKRMSDISFSALLLVITSPILLISAILAKIGSEATALYRSKRIGKDGQEFVMYKLRSMVKDADKMLSKMQDLNEGGPHMVKIPKDPRTTLVGRFLRRYSIDELPQLWNVLKGDMSLVGPRPQAPNEVALYNDYQRRRLEVLPGITGLWQVTARDNADFDQWVKLDIEYIDTWSLWFDTKIALKTIWVILEGKGGEVSDRKPQLVH
jgi:lipopolysaccharide/colanic/teichoic acid biosynthesis glycosyltransferase